MSQRPKWKTLKHNGPLFPKPYKRLPRNVNLLYNGRKFKLSKNAEEAATLYAKLIYDKASKLARFRRNFFQDWKMLMTPKERQKIKSIRNCNFKKIYQYLEKQTELNKQRNKRNKVSLAKKRNKEQEKYGVCYIDGKKQKIANYKIEPPGIFRGRGTRRQLGRIKPRLKPSDVVINIGKRARIPKPSASGQWKDVVHDNRGLWLASWDDLITRKKKYIYPGPSATIKVKNDIEKFEKARDLEMFIRAIRTSYEKGAQSKTPYIKQRSLALFLIDKLALRIGNETGPESSETYGSCSLLKRHVKPSSSGGMYYLQFNFKSKDSIDYKRLVTVSKKIYRAFQECLSGKSQNDKILDMISPSELNSYLYTIDMYLSSKVFRTYNASKTFEDKLFSVTDEYMTLDEKMLSLDKAYIAVAKLCNHKKTVPKSYNRGLKTLSKRIKKLEKKLEKLEDEMEDAEDDSRIAKRFENTLDKLKKSEIQQTRKILTADWNLNTGKTNYIDPRIIVAWAKTFEVPINKVFTPTQRQKFEWAMKTRKDFVF